VYNNIRQSDYKPAVLKVFLQYSAKATLI